MATIPYKRTLLIKVGIPEGVDPRVAYDIARECARQGLAVDSRSLDDELPDWLYKRLPEPGPLPFEGHQRVEVKTPEGWKQATVVIASQTEVSVRFDDGATGTFATTWVLPVARRDW